MTGAMPWDDLGRGILGHIGRFATNIHPPLQSVVGHIGSAHHNMSSHLNQHIMTHASHMTGAVKELPFIKGSEVGNHINQIHEWVDGGTPYYGAINHPFMEPNHTKNSDWAKEKERELIDEQNQKRHHSETTMQAFRDAYSRHGQTMKKVKEAYENVVLYTKNTKRLSTESFQKPSVQTNELMIHAYETRQQEQNDRDIMTTAFNAIENIPDPKSNTLYKELSVLYHDRIAYLKTKRIHDFDTNIQDKIDYEKVKIREKTLQHQTPSWSSRGRTSERDTEYQHRG